MTLQEIDALIEDTRKLPRAADKVALSTALATLEVARQLAILNEHLGKWQFDVSKAAKAGK